MSAPVALFVRLAELRAERDAKVRAADADYEAGVIVAVAEELRREAGGDDPNRLIPTAEVLELLGVSERGLRRLRADPAKAFPIPNMRVDSDPRWLLWEVRQWNNAKDATPNAA